jgi:hypothetical protein
MSHLTFQLDLIKLTNSDLNGAIGRDQKCNRIDTVGESNQNDFWVDVRHLATICCRSMIPVFDPCPVDSLHATPRLKTPPSYQVTLSVGPHLRNVVRALHAGDVMVKIRENRLKSSMQRVLYFTIC